MMRQISASADDRRQNKTEQPALNRVGCFLFVLRMIYVGRQQANRASVEIFRGVIIFESPQRFRLCFVCAVPAATQRLVHK